jgi:hypothetical protein
MIYVVLGMHKSGTTLIAQILHHSGISMGEHLDSSVSYDQGNKYEREAAFGLNLAILGKSDVLVLDVDATHGRVMSLAQREIMRAIIRDCDRRHSGTWGFKDPRTCLTWPLWRQELPEHRIIAVYRDPAEVWPRFKWHGMRKRLNNFQYAWSYLNRWYEHNQGLMEAVAQAGDRAVVLGYHELMTGDREFKRLGDFVGRALDDRRRPELYRHRDRGDIFLRWADRRLARKLGKNTEAVMDELRAWRIRTGAR